MNFCTASGMSGNINFGSSSATGSKIKLLSPTVECQAVPTIGNSVCNKTYVDSISGPTLLGLTNVWTGTRNTFNNPVYVSSLVSAGAMSITATSGTLGLYASNGMAINTTTGDINIGANSGVVGIEDLKISGNNIQSISGGINIASSSGDVNITAPAGQIYLTASTPGSVIIEGFSINGTAIQPSLSGAGTFDFCTNDIAVIYIGGPSAKVNLAGTAYSSHEFTAGGGIAKHDFHSCSNTNTNDYDGQIVSTGGTVGTVGKGAMQYTGASHKFAGGGISFDKGTIQSPVFIQSGFVGGGPVIAGNSVMAPNWVVAWSSMAGGISFPNPTAYLSASLTLQTTSTACSGIVLSVFAISRTTITIQAYNSNGTVAPVNAWGVSIMVIGSY